MKIIFKIFLLIVAIILVLFFWKLYAESHTDSKNVRNLANLNPLITSEKYYIQTNEPKSVKDSGKDIKVYEYTNKAYDKDGNGKEITYTATKKLKTNHYLEIDYKIGEVKGYTEVKEKDIPKKAKVKL
ncbi:YxeA family protein [Staphylococcus xylosus]|uniref:YxeA family protein n=2 Tax=Staphylococcus xylosus TaxID=1288 RepID=A0A5R9B5X0_STAXY|nr:YxeA family protein [Staphylococcus xylosus]MCE4994740.1 YxeA family protein [Staphylococcus xylosus]MEB6297585.1 YxeA family protein [Staphylococcus xylosus]RIM74983.1 YxeA family protein [Staphylococcus xylosus]TLP91025.1 YxeA family protein [Staphylococcus xylosus]